MKLFWGGKKGNKKSGKPVTANATDTTQKDRTASSSSGNSSSSKLVEPHPANQRIETSNPQHSSSRSNPRGTHTYKKIPKAKRNKKVQSKGGSLRSALGMMKKSNSQPSGAPMAPPTPPKESDKDRDVASSANAPISMPVALAVTAVDVDNFGRRIKEITRRKPGFYGDSDSSSGEEELLLEDGLEDDIFKGPDKPIALKKPEKLSKQEVLLKVPFFKQFKEDHRKQLFEQLVEVTFGDGETIVRQNRQGDRFYVIVDGEAVVSSTQPDGSEVDITHIYTGDYFGEMSLIYGQRRVANVTSVGKTTCMYLMKETFDRFEEIKQFLILLKVPLLSELTRENQIAILRKLKPVNFAPGQYVVKQGEKGDAFYMITKGSAVVTEGGTSLGSNRSEDQFDPDPHGTREKVITHLYEGHSFGEMALLTEEVRVASVRAVDHLSCMRLEARDFKRLLGDDEFAQLLARENNKIVHLRERRTMRQGRSDATSPRHMSSVGSHSSMVREQRKLTRAVTLKGEKVINGFVMLHEIGKGTYGRVNLCRKANTGEYFAIKTINKSPFHKTPLKSRHIGSLEDMKREVAIMKKLAHPNVVNLFEVIDDPAADQLYLIQEYCSKGAIMPDLATSKPFSEEKARHYFRMLLSGLDYLHYENVIHRDIKPMNLLLTEDDVLKISDFGAARVLMGHGDQLVGVAGTPAFMAPELLSLDTAQYSGSAVDLWSCGATLYMMVIGHPPWMADDELTLAYRVKNDELMFPITHKLDPHLKSLINNLLVKDASRRMDLPAAMTHSWVTEEGTNELPRYVASEAFDEDASLRRSLTEDERNEAITRLRQNSLNTASQASFSTVTSDVDLFGSPVNSTSGSFFATSPRTQRGPQPSLSTDSLPSLVAASSLVQPISAGTGSPPVASRKTPGSPILQKLSRRKGDHESGDTGFVRPRDAPGLSGSSLHPRGKGASLPSGVKRTTGAVIAPSTHTGRSGTGRDRSHTTDTIEIDLGDNIHRVDDIDDFSDDESGTDGDDLFSMEVDAPSSGATSTQVEQNSKRLGAKPKRLSDHTLDIGRMHSFVNRKIQEETDKQNAALGSSAGGTIDGASSTGALGSGVDIRSLGLHPQQPQSHPLLHPSADDGSSNGVKKRRPSSAPFPAVDSGVVANMIGKGAISDPSLQRLPSSISFVKARSGLPIPWARLLIGVEQYQGIRATMEDTTCFVPMLGGRTFFCGVYDGHGGSYVAERLRDGLHTTISARSTFQTDLERAIRRGCHAFDRKLLYDAAVMVTEHQSKVSKGESCRKLTRTKGDPKPSEWSHEQGHRAGSTAVFAFVRSNSAGDRTLTVGWVGDSRAVCSRAGEAVRLSQDHKASREDETKRIRSCSGTVDRQGRLYGDLAVSRAFGNLQHKGRDLARIVDAGPVAEDSDDESQAQGPLVATPDCCTIQLGAEHEFVILASDGVWDVFSDQDAVNFVRYQLHSDSAGSARKAAKALMDKAFMRGSVDNMSCVIVGF